MDVRPLQEVVAYGYQRFVVSRLRHRDMKIPVDVKKELDVMLLQGDTGGLQQRLHSLDLFRLGSAGRHGGNGGLDRHSCLKGFK